ncbi:MAG: hypothetical protein F9K40_11340 [Kofleriaceae bacterium]|nr:MAG: hypothetical protein F9K40_11340 [Kofleriaceae bacterium]MBZ0236194.1 hypothetical protein [Kofleriaceae bacterium]
MGKQPWLNILAGTVAPEVRELGFAEALESPCATCKTAPCCTYLPLHRFPVDTMLALDHARYLLNFDRIELGMAASGEWSAYYRFPCRHLERATFRCTVHDTAAQPDICKNFNPYACWYKRALRSPVSDGFLRIDRPRIEYIVERTVFDEQRNIVAVPSWDELSEAFRTMPCDEQSYDEAEIGKDVVLDRWREQVISAASLTRKERNEPEPRTVGYDDLDEPCTDCAAWCCSTLVFPHGFPSTRTNLDYLRFTLGFPGIEVGVHDGGWSIIVKTRCRHLRGNRCGVFGKPERPLLCRYYDAHACAYKVHFGEERPAGYVRVRLEEFSTLAGLFRFDPSGAVVELPAAERVRTAIETSWCQPA